MSQGFQKIFFAQNIKFLRERRKMSQEMLAAKLGLTRAKLAALEAGNTKSPQPEDYINYSGFFKISIDTLLKIDLSKLGELKIRDLEAGNDVYIRGGNLRVLAISVDRSNNENVEYVPVKAKAGYMAGYNDPEFIAALPKYSIPNLPKQGTFRIFPSTGDSMLPVPEGSDIVAQYVPDWTALKPDTPCIVILRGQQDFVFKMVTLNAEGAVLLKSLNTEYNPYSVEAGEVMEIWRFYAYTSRKFPEARPEMATILEAIRKLEGKVRQISKNSGGE
ncbi:Transcriptional regulator, contains XRE-family HTH domain [Mariniphaga anaerophila]|uniref:Transcriptional regulator, contains XRE-family HTH domain n=1 Tax=Mariniphaga anaerophila TaxID=1484053 RepID=A0A1M4VRI8_9BACT|nr:helix-turn-helix domain-containing protein [Mariniphaga anaerophila]SHE71467.1 Transcriptional regulator, contains XRE-family HTH domain [Mariniphaga anaerophila]